jgi:hypothetical protein
MLWCQLNWPKNHNAHSVQGRISFTQVILGIILVALLVAESVHAVVISFTQVILRIILVALLVAESVHAVG